MHTMNRFFVALSALVFLSLASTAQAGKAPVYTSLFSDTALKGYDTVAYFTDGKPVKGDKQFSTEWNGATWQFATAENLAAFEAAPEKYAPQYGGYCAWRYRKVTLRAATLKSGQLSTASCTSITTMMSARLGVKIPLVSSS